MLRETDVFDAQGFAFADMGEPKAPALVTVEQGAHGATATIADAHLLFNSDFTRSGNDLHIDGHSGDRAIVSDYFGIGERASLMSHEGARLSPDLVEALTKSVAPHQYAQATPPAPAASDAVGRVVTASSDSTILRNGVPVTVRPGDPVLRADVLQTAGGTMAVTFNDGSTLNLTANTRIVVSEFIYSPSNTGNSQLLDLIQGSLTFISGEVAHSGDMRIGTPVATMGIRGTVGGVTTASDGTVQFYVSQSATGAVIINQQGQIIANVVQDGPLIVVRPVGPLQVVADEIQKSPAQLALELQALQQIVNIKAIGDQLLQQFFQQQQQQSPNPQSPQGGPHTQIPVDDRFKITLFQDNPGNNGTVTPLTHAVIETLIKDPDGPPTITVPLPVNLPPVTFAPLSLTTAEDTPLVFGGSRAISIVDNDSSTLTVTLSVTNGVLSLGNVAGLTFSAGDGANDGAMTFSGSPAAIAAALNGLTYTPSQDYNGPATLSISAGDGNSALLSTTVTLNVTAVNDAPVLNYFNFNVSGDDPVVLTSSDFSVTDPDGPNVIFTVTNVTGGEFVVDSGSNNLFSIQSFQQGPVTFTADDIANGRVKFVPDGSGDPVSYSVSVSDGIDSSSAVEDHLPVAKGVSADVVAGTAASSYNLVFILDVSGSMGSEVSQGVSRLDLAKQAIENLLESSSVPINQVMVVAFDGQAYVYDVDGNHWVSAAQANQYVQSLQPGGGTYYDTALDAVADNWGQGPSSASKTVAYFISDGEPSSGHGANAGTWESFLQSNNVDISYAIGISTNVNDADLAPIAWSSTNPNFAPIVIDSATDLNDTLQGTFVATHNIFDDGADFGGDGGRILSIAVDGQTYTWDGLNTVSSSSQAQWSHTASSLTVTTALGGILTFYFGDEGQAHQAGDWTYTPPDNVDHSSNEVFRYTLVDNDGDKASASITVHVYDQDGPNPSNDSVFTNASGSFDIPDWVLLRNDNDPDGFLSVETVSNAAAPISASHCDDQVTVDLNGLAGDNRTFTYTVSDTRLTDSATVTVTQAASLDQSQSTDDRILVAASASIMIGGSGNNVLIGSDGNDAMTGNGGSDAFVFQPGGGEDRIEDFSGHAGQGDVIALDGFSFSSFNELKQNADITDIGQDGHHTTLIDFGGGDTITLVDVDPNQLTAADFIFHPAQYNIG
ncbi:VWA domain-containing protein [Pseudolabrys sp. FHR47]|uniref:VWA domain-containing protein n=1 Tax=Pseudolabrys sp. FHR47 TaxID=2562284 RepID=UPI0010BE94B3|nr:VWA domain-containing protein [Pseudolabrys sp. FHR47]